VTNTPPTRPAATITPPNSNPAGPGQLSTTRVWPGPLFSSGPPERPTGRGHGHHGGRQIRSPSPSLAVSRGRSLIGRGPDRSTHARTALRRTSDLFGPTEVNPKALRAGLHPGRKPCCAQHGLFGVDRPPSAD
jgi:hypothetical protein